MSEYILRPKPGFDIREVGENPTDENSVIFEYRYGRLKNIYPVNQDTLLQFKPKLPPEYYEKERIGKITLDRPLPAGHFACGISPFIQILFRKTSEMVEADFSDLYQAVVSEYRIAPDEQETFREIRALVEWMSKAGGPGFLTTIREGGKIFYRAGRSPKCDAPLVGYRRGINPIEDQICEIVERKGTTSYGDIKSYIIDGLGWLTNEKYLKNQIEKLVKKGSLTRFAKDYFKFVRRPEFF